MACLETIYLVIYIAIFWQKYPEKRNKKYTTGSSIF